MGFLKAPQPPPLPPVPPPPPPPVVRDPIDTVQDKVKKDEKRRKGADESILTSGMGLTTEGEVSAPSLLGSKKK